MLLIRRPGIKVKNCDIIPLLSSSPLLLRPNDSAARDGRTKHLKFKKLTLFCVSSALRRLREGAYLSRDPQRAGNTLHQKTALRSVGAAPATEGIPLRDVCFFCSTEEMRVREGGGVEVG